MRRAAGLLVLLAAAAFVAPARAQVEVQAIPAVEGVRANYAGQELTTDAHGRLFVVAPDRATVRARLRVEPTTLRHGTHAHFRGWRHGRVTLTLLHQVRVLFQDPKGRHVDPRRIDAATLKGPAGLRADVAVGKSQWLAGNRIALLGRRPISRTIAWAVERVTADGADVVARSQQRFRPARVRHPRVTVRFFRLGFKASDALLGSAIGSQIGLRYPDGHTERHPLGSGGQFNFGSLPRGAYTVTVRAPGFAKTWPVSLSRDQQMDVSVISYLDVLLVVGALMAIAVGLLLVGRRRVRRAAA